LKGSAKNDESDAWHTTQMQQTTNSMPDAAEMQQMTNSTPDAQQLYCINTLGIPKQTATFTMINTSRRYKHTLRGQYHAFLLTLSDLYVEQARKNNSSSNGHVINGYG
jgi:hypothetical protein